MKLLSSLLSLATIGALLAISSCKPSGGTPQTVQEIQLGLLAKKWKVTNVFYGASASTNTDVTSSWTNFNITIAGSASDTSKNTYTCAQRATLGPWPASGKWMFGTDLPSSQVVRDPKTSPTNWSYNVTATTLELSISDYAGPSYAGPRVANTSGYWLFKFTPAP